MYGRVLCEKLSKNFSVRGGNPAADPADWDPDPEKAPHPGSGATLIYYTTPVRRLTSKKSCWLTEMGAGDL
jgi:hypothetical protein